MIELIFIPELCKFRRVVDVLEDHYSATPEKDKNNYKCFVYEYEKKYVTPIILN